MIHLRPEDSIRIQEELGSDVAMVLDHLVALPAAEDVAKEACLRSIRWAERCKAVRSRKDQAMFAIVQGGLDESLRINCAEQLTQIGFDGYAVGGLSVVNRLRKCTESWIALVPFYPLTSHVTSWV